MRYGVGAPALGIALLVLLPADGIWARDAEIPAFNSRLLDVYYELRGEKARVTEVGLYLTLDEGRHWQLHASARNPAGEPSSPLQVRVSQDGVYGLFVVVQSLDGASGNPPEPGQEAQQWVLVDTAPPLIQIQQTEVVDALPAGGRMLVVSWSAYDTNLGDRPVSIYYQAVDQPGWVGLVSGIPNLGRYDWAMPSEVRGGLQVRIEVVDRAGNTASDVSATITAEPVMPVRAPSSAENIDGNPQQAAQPAPQLPTGTPGSKSDPEKAQKLYELGLWHKQRGDYVIALERLLEALNLDPQATAPAFELAEIYHAQGNYTGALDIYQGILGQRPDDREALRGTALAMVALGRYPEALSSLELVLRGAPDDAETWLHAGDVLLMMGQSAEARQYWNESLRLKPRKSEITNQARKRLEKYALEARSR